MTTGSMYWKFYKVWTCGFCDMCADRETYGHGDRTTWHPCHMRSNKIT